MFLKKLSGGEKGMSNSNIVNNNNLRIGFKFL